MTIVHLLMFSDTHTQSQTERNILPNMSSTATVLLGILPTRTQTHTQCSVNLLLSLHLNTHIEAHTRSLHFCHLSTYTVSLPAHFIELILSSPPTLLYWLRVCVKNAQGTHEEAVFVRTWTIHHGLINTQDFISLSFSPGTMLLW